ncbi:hypothetical protein [Oerskovia jenensis]|uniref:hypothetical protein n=1 Tax=Oerskovia jenensis TaxID=162169 RepID=UPI0036DDFAF5
MSAAYWFPDNSTLCNFGAVQRIGLLERVLISRGRWTSAVEFEVRRSLNYVSGLAPLLDGAWLGEAIDPVAEQAMEIENVRQAVFGGKATEPLKHLGEAQTCFVLRTDPGLRSSATWITDDLAAYDYGKASGLLTWSTRDVEYLIADGDLSPAQGYDLLGEMQDNDRCVLRMPGAAAELH